MRVNLFVFIYFIITISLLWQAFGQPLLETEIELFKKSIQVLESVNNKNRLYQKVEYSTRFNFNRINFASLFIYLKPYIIIPGISKPFKPICFSSRLIHGLFVVASLLSYFRPIEQKNSHTITLSPTVVIFTVFWTC